MQPGQPSRTALGAATHRAVHQVLEHGAIFADPLAVRILGEDVEEAVREAQANPARRILRLFIALRARFAEDALRAAVARGVRQLVVLGAGLDTFAYRNELGERLHVFEVDHPATQAWKRQRLAEAEIPLPRTLTFAPVDFERETLADGLAAAGFNPAQQTFFTWLGVAPYLTEQAVFSTLEYIVGLRGGAHVVFDFVAEQGAEADAFAMTRRAGSHFVIGYGGTVHIPTLDIISTERNIIGNIVGTYNELAELMALAQAGKVTLHTRTYPLDAAPDALADLDAGRVRGRAILVP